MSFSEILKFVWERPSIDASETLRKTDFSLDTLAYAYKVGDESLKKKMEKEVTDLGYTIVSSGSDVFVSSEDGSTKLVNKNGVLYLEEIANENKKTVRQFNPDLHDESDAEDYDYRYVSVDSKKYTDNGSEIAYIQIVTNSDKPEIVFPNFDNSPSPGITRNKFKQFIVLQSSVASQERLQIVETNEHYQALFFGQKPEILQIAGVLKNTIDNPWTMNMIFLWDELMRGTKLVENGLIARFYVDGALYSGYPFAFNRSQVAQMDNVVNFNFNFLIKDKITVYTENRVRP